MSGDRKYAYIATWFYFENLLLKITARFIVKSDDGGCASL